MLPMPSSSWTETDLETLIGQTESIRREFKSGRLFDIDESKWISTLSAEVSAFANTEGGELFLGIDEDKKSRPRVALTIDGAPVGLAPERLQQLIEGNVSPYLPGIRVQRVKLFRNPEKVVFIIRIPQGSTAYQAKDGRYYGRSEFEIKFLPDHEVRLRMSRGKVARGLVSVRVLRTELGATREEALHAAHMKTEGPLSIDQRLELMQAETFRDKITFDFVFRNEGELTIRNPVIELIESRSPLLFDQGVNAQSLPTRCEMQEETVYPGDERIIASSERWLQCKRDVSFANGDYVVRWKVFLDNSPPTFGDIDLGILIQGARSRTSDH